LHWNPLVKIKAISHRKDAIYYGAAYAWENTWLAAPTRYVRDTPSAQDGGRQRQDINVTLGGCALLARGDLDQEASRARPRTRFWPRSQ